MVSDRLFEGKVKRKKKLKEVEVPDPKDLASNRPPQQSLSTTNSPARATSKSVQVGGPYDEEANLQELTPAGKQAAAEREKQKDAEKRGDPRAAGEAEAARKHNIAIRNLRPRVSPAGRVSGKKYREDPV
jgi:hypothetical protein